MVESLPSLPTLIRKSLTEDDAVDIWIARWLRIRRKDIIQRYGCDPRRLYEIWDETRFIGSRSRALALFQERFPWALDRVDTGPHRTRHKGADPDQLPLFE